jgi:hypothetical protein
MIARVLLGVMLTMPLSALAQVAEVRVMSRDVLVGQPFDVRVQVVVPGGRVVLPAVVDTGGVVEPLDPPAAELRGDTTVVTWRLIAWEAGEQQMPVSPVVVRRADGTDTAFVVPSALQVTSVLPADTTQRTPRPAQAAFALGAPWWKRWWPWALLLAAVVAAFIAMRVRRGKDGRRRDDVSPAHAARVALQRLGMRQLMDLGEPTRHAVLAGDILRDFLARAHPSCARSLDTNEVIEAARAAWGDAGDLVGSALRQVDLLRFGGARVDTVGAESVERTVRQAIIRIEQLHALRDQPGKAA